MAFLAPRVSSAAPHWAGPLCSLLRSNTPQTEATKTAQTTNNYFPISTVFPTRKVSTEMKAFVWALKHKQFVRHLYSNWSQIYFFIPFRFQNLKRNGANCIFDGFQIRTSNQNYVCLTFQRLRASAKNNSSDKAGR